MPIASAAAARRYATAAGALVLLTLFNPPAWAEGPDPWDVIESWNGRIAPSPKALSAPRRTAGATDPAPGGDPSIPVSLLAVPVPRRDGTGAYVPVLVEIGGAELIAGDSGIQLAGQIIGTATDAGGLTAASFTQPFTIGLDEDNRATMEATGLKLLAELRLTPGRYQVTVEVRNEGTNSRGIATLPLQVSDFAAPTLSPPLFSEPLDRWKLYRQETALGAEEPFPFLAPGNVAFIPAARPRIAPGSPATFYLLAFGYPDEPAITAWVAGTEGEDPSIVPLTVVAREPGPLPQQTLLTLRLDSIPASPGAYRLEVAAEGEGGRRLQLPFVVAADAPTAEQIAPAAVDEEHPKEPEVLHGDLSPEETGRLYRSILGQAAGGDFERASTRLRALEVSVTAGNQAGEMKALRKLELEILRPFLERSPDALLPILYLYYLADDGYFANDQIWHAAQSRVFVTDLVQRYAKVLDSDQARALGSQILATLGCATAALRLDPDNSLARLRLAIASEKAARELMTLEHLQHLVKVDPGNTHGRLRLAVNLRRTGEVAEARALLAHIVRDPSPVPEWILGLAYQELASLEMDRHNFDLAERILEQGIERLGHQRLYLQLAFYLDQQGDRDAGIAVLNQMTASSEAEIASPRHLYNGQPDTEIAQAAEALRLLAESRRPLLGQALGSEPRLGR